MWFRLISVIIMAVWMAGSSPAGAMATEEYDAVLRSWQQGQSLHLKHPLFSLTQVKAKGKEGHVILYTGRSGGSPGSVTLLFFTQDGDVLHVPRGSLYMPTVGKDQRDFTVGGIVPQQLRGQIGQVQVMFQGKAGERASFYLKVYF